MRRGRQDGFVFFLALVIFAGIFGIYFAAQLQAGSNIREANRIASLEETRNALIGYAVRETTGGNRYRLGNFPNPDSLANGSYDGNSDINMCLSNSVNGVPPVTGSGASKRCLGKIPWKELGISFGTTDSHDPLGLVPWIAVSANLAYWDSCLEKLNSEVINWTYTSHACPAVADTLPYPWLTVRDESGKVLSDRVAAVIILPGPQIATETRTQSRTPANPGNPADYLDAIRLPLGCVACSVTYDNAGLNNEFIRVSPGARYPVDAENTALRGEPIPFNDRVDFITIDELLPHLERRVLADMSAALVAMSNLGATPIGYPWAAPPALVASNADIVPQPLARLGNFPFYSAFSTGSSPPFGYPLNKSAIYWSFSTGFSVPPRDCRQITPGTWINVNQRIRNGANSTVTGATDSGPIPVTGAKCAWNGITRLSCDVDYTESRSFTFTRFGSSANCSASSGSIGTGSYTRSRRTYFQLDATCSGTPTTNYLAASSTQSQRFQWACTSVAPTSAFTINIDEDFGSGIVASRSFLGTGRNVTIAINYYPLMPSWYYGNDWHLSAFYALAPGAAPAGGSTDCGGATSLSVASGSIDKALVMLAGSRLPNLPATPTQTRPSATLSNYFEGTNLTGFSNCIFGALDDKPNASRNDQLFAVKP